MKRRIKMVYFFRSMGVFLFPMLIIAGVILFLAIRKSVDLFGGRDLPPNRLEKGLHAILFWGIVAAVLGFLGQISGIYNALGVIFRATEISPKVIAMGFAESFTTTIFGIEIGLVAAIVWFVLYRKYRNMVSA